MFKSGFKSRKKSSTTLKSKGERLGWVSVRDAKPVKLRNLLTDGEVVNVDNTNPILVP